MFEKGKIYKVEEVGSKYDNVQGEYIKTMKDQKTGVRYAVLRKGRRHWWIPEMYWKYIKTEENQ